MPDFDPIGLKKRLNQAQQAASGQAARPVSRPEPKRDEDDRNVLDKTLDWLGDVIDPAGAERRAQVRARARYVTGKPPVPEPPKTR